MNLRPRLKWAGVLAAFFSVGCAVGPPAPVPPDELAQTARALKNLSSMALGRGYDRALDMRRNDCFQRDPAVSTPINAWSASGSLVYDKFDFAQTTKLDVGVAGTIEGVDLSFGVKTNERIARGGENGFFVFVASYESHSIETGQATGGSSACSNINVRSANGVEDFVSSCGDRYMQKKTLGGRVIVSWRRSTTNDLRDRTFQTDFGVGAEGVKGHADVTLGGLISLGFGDEEVFVEVSGMPFPPVPEDVDGGESRYTVKSIAQYFKDIAVAGGGTPAQFAGVVDYELERYSVSEIDLCLKATGHESTLPEPEWACVYDQLTEVADMRDAIGSWDDLARKFAIHERAFTELLPAGRLQFTTLPQSRCVQDLDGDPDFEVSGPCQEEPLRNFVEHYGACQLAAKNAVEICREATILGAVTQCRQYQMACTLPVTPAGAPCTEAALNASLAAIVPYTVNPPRGPVPPGAQFSAPLVLEFTDTPRARIPNVSTLTHLCGLTGVRGGLHESTAWVMADGKDWVVEVKSANPDPDKAIAVEVTCTSLENFFVVNGVATLDGPRSELVPVPAANGGTPFRGVLTSPGDTSLLGWKVYVSGDRTSLGVTNPLATGVGDYLGFDSFLLASTDAIVGTHTIRSNPSASSGRVGGSPAFDTVGAPSMMTVGLAPGSRQPLRVTFPLPNDAFCYLTGLSGHWYNASDSVRISRSGGITTLVTATPLTKDRNPGAQAQCLFLDQL